MIHSGDFCGVSGIYRVIFEQVDQKEFTVVYGESFPEYRGERVKFKLVKAAPHWKKGL